MATAGDCQMEELKEHGWEVVYSEDHKRNYYYNSALNVTTWNHPGEPPKWERKWLEIDGALCGLVILILTLLGAVVNNAAEWEHHMDMDEF